MLCYIDLKSLKSMPIGYEAKVLEIDPQSIFGKIMA
jgi:hypothetical protein